MTNAYIQEYLAIAGFLAKSNKVSIRKGFVLVDRKLLDSLLQRNAYDTAENKLRIWKNLRWIDTDPDRYTKKVSLDGKRVRVVKIDELVYRTLAEIHEKPPGQIGKTNT